MHLLILYEELAYYFVNCLNSLAQTHNAKILVFSKKINDVAPFKFDNIHPNITIHYREHFSEERLITVCKDFKPDMVYIGGWANKLYIKTIKLLSSPNTIIGFDNHYTGSLKQLLGRIYFRMRLKPYIQSAFVPGPQQFDFAKRLGFKKQNIAQGIYCCDTDLFTSYYQQYKTQKQKQFPKRFLFVGRYAAEKGISLLWECFTELQTERPNDWELWCVGKGNIAPALHPKIKHFGFLQPNELGDVISKTGVFVLPSTFEPWGVVLHEYATAGFPLLTTNQVGAAVTFLENSQNGFVVNAGNKMELKSKLKDFMAMSDKNLNLMAEKSVNLSAKITPIIWAENLMKLYADKPD